MERYFPIAAGSLPFSIGAVIFFYSKGAVPNNLFSKVNISAASLFVLLIANAVLGLVIFHLPNSIAFQELAFYINLILGSLLVHKIATGDNILELSGKVDKFIGDFSNPIYLSHWQVGLLVSFFSLAGPCTNYQHAVWKVS